MDRLAELEATRKTQIEALRALLKTAETEKRSALNDDESKKFATLQAEIDQLDKLIEAERKTRALEQTLSDPEQPAPRPDPQAPTGPVVHTREDRPYSLKRAFQASAEGAAWNLAKVEKRASDELAELYGRSPSHGRGFFAPYSALLTDREQRKIAQEQRAIGKAVPNTTGAAVIATDLMPDEFIDILRNETKVLMAGARELPGLVGDVDIPRQSAAASAGWVTENVGVSESTLSTDTISLTPKTVGLKGTMTRRMLQQSTPGIEDLVRLDMRAAIALAIDAGAINGSGLSGQPEGVLNVSGIGGVTTSGTLTWPLVVEFETDLAAANALMGSLAFLMGATVGSEFKTTARESGTGVYLMQDGKINNYPALLSNQVPAQTAIFGNWADLLIGLWGSLDLFADPYTSGDAGNMLLRGFQDIDVAVRHPASFTAAADI